MKLQIKNALVHNIISAAYESFISTQNKPSKFSSSIADLLGILPQTVSRKFADKKSFSSDELQKIISCFNLSFSCNEKHKAELLFKPLGGDEQEIINYFENILKRLEYIHQCKTKKIRLTCEDMPLFYYFGHNYLAAFKIYFYKQTLFPSKSTLDEAFIEEFGTNRFNRIFELYQDIPSEELWSPRTIDSTIFQLIYYFDTGKIKEVSILNYIINELFEMVDQIFDFAEDESKDGEHKNLTIYRTDGTIGNNQISVQTDDVLTSFVNVNIFNSIQINNPVYVAEVSNWMNYMFKAGIKISGDGSASRINLQNIYKKKLELLRQYIIHQDHSAKIKLIGY